MNERQRIEKLLQSEGITAREFAQHIGISAGTLSNILGGRNKPSLEVMQAILNVYRHVSTDWLILDAGPMYRGERDAGASAGEQEGPTLPFGASEQNKGGQGIAGPNKGGQNVSCPKSVQKITVFYTDGTFEER